MIRRVGNLRPPPCQHPEHSSCSSAGLGVGVYEHICPGCAYTFTFEVTPLDVWRQDQDAERARREAAGQPLTPEELKAWCVVPEELRRWMR